MTTFGAVSQDSKFELTFSEEFNYRGLPDPEKWSFEEGFVRNMEPQYYTKERRKNARVKNGNLIIEGRKDQIRNDFHEEESTHWRTSPKKTKYTSASINTLGKFGFKYGRVRVRAKLPQGQGVWPAIWMLGTDVNEVEWPYSGEIDIMEFVGKDNNHIHGTVHYPADNKVQYDSDGEKLFVPDLHKDFHVYGINWTEDKIEFLIDNELYHTFNIEDAGSMAYIFRKPYYLLLNLALGGGWAGELNESILPQQFLIDYVRVYQEKE
ncbi:glycoside hydrolase family 16 protein [Salegentibacter sp. F188]|uniref:Glycoside hydrolase family 16 protein n=1 Tax=Autumnicola patrickiae TaxID=3075591 RepID=A0ABU3E446_9FLAO|nr:glycoside hydrolase family 16 protein [Salegentibacter sp. F188]MDT0690673.1 glycoside hydrolase family 16 protein [Salegentibacter sp. F188]